jgi:spermidine synthase
MEATGRRSDVLERARTPRGDFLLRQVDGRLELVANGVFLVDAGAGASERVLVERALTGPGGDVLIGGLGFGSSVHAALDAGARSVVVVENEPLVVEWYERHLPASARRTIGDPRVELVLDDVAAFVARSDRRYDAICLDTDNGPDVLAHPENAALYSPDWLRLARSRLRPGGRLAVWCAAPSAPLAAALGATFASVEVVEVPARRGPPDVVYLAATEPGP